MRRVLLLITPFLVALTLANQLKAQEDKMTITYEATEGGTISAAYWYDAQWKMYNLPSGQELKKGTHLFLNHSAVEGYGFSHWEVNGEVELGITGPLDRAFNETAHIKAVFTKTQGSVTHRITLTAGDGGKVEGKYLEVEPSGQAWNITFDGKKQIAEGTEITATATPDPGYMIDKWVVNGAEVSPTDPNAPHIFKFTADQSKNVHVRFKPGESGSPVYLEIGEGGKLKEAWVQTNTGKVSHNSGDKISAGLELEITVEPDEGYEVDQWLDNGEHISSADGAITYRTTIQGETTIKVSFKKKEISSYSVFFSSNEGATVLAKYTDEKGEKFPKSGDKIKKGTKVTFWVNLSEDYELVNWFINEEAKPEFKEKKEITHIIDGDVSVRVEVKKNMSEESSPVTLEIGEGGKLVEAYVETTLGKVKYTSGDKVVHGAELVVTVEANEDFVVDAWHKNGTAIAEANGKTTYRTKIEGETTLKVTFKKKEKTASEVVASAQLRPVIVEEVLYLRGIAKASHVAIYDITGKKHYDGVAYEQMDVCYLANGIYFVAVDGKTYKVIK